MSLRSELGRVKGLGAAGGGVHHWRLQRITAICLIPLALWFITSMLCAFKGDHAAVIAWIGKPHVTVLLLGLSVSLFWHLQLGLQVVIEDYVHTTWKQVAMQLLLRAGAALGALVAVVSILKIALGSH